MRGPLCALAWCKLFCILLYPRYGVDIVMLKMQVLRDARGLFVAGCCFDELPPSVIMEAVTSARSAGAAIFFDPGPRSWTFREPERRGALNDLLDSTDVMLMTEVLALLALLITTAHLPLCLYRFLWDRICLSAISTAHACFAFDHCVKRNGRAWIGQIGQLPAETSMPCRFMCVWFPQIRCERGI